MPFVVKLIIPLAFGSVLYTALFVSQRGGEDTAAATAASGAQVRLSGDGAGGSGGGGRGAANLRNSFRQLSMIGYEEETGGQGEEWMKCREYEETELGPHKKVRGVVSGHVGRDRIVPTRTPAFVLGYM